MVLQNVDKAQLKLRTKKDNVAGIVHEYIHCKIISELLSDPLGWVATDLIQYNLDYLDLIFMLAPWLSGQSQAQAMYFCTCVCVCVCVCGRGGGVIDL